MRSLAVAALLAVAGCATVNPESLVGRHELLSVDGRAMPVDYAPLPSRDGSRGDPYVFAAGHLDLTATGRYEMYREYRNGRTGQVLARQSEAGTYQVIGSRLTLREDPAVYPSGGPTSWTGTIGPETITISYYDWTLVFRR